MVSSLKPFSFGQKWNKTTHMAAKNLNAVKGLILAGSVMSEAPRAELGRRGALRDAGSKTRAR